MMTVPFRYKKLGYAALSVTDLERSTAFYRDLVGLDISDGEANRHCFLRCSRDHHNLALYKSAEPGLRRIGFELESEADLAAARAHIVGLGLEICEIGEVERRLLRQRQGFRFNVPHCGITLEFYIGILYMAAPFQKRLADIERIGHVVVAVEKFDETVAWLMAHLGFRVSDFVEGFAAFLRCHPNPYHHTLALVRSATNHLHHVNFMVHDIDDIGRALHRMQKHQVEIVFGPGRHQPSESIFLYYLDPDGITIEYSFGMEEFAASDAREPRVLEPGPASLDSWGGMPAANFGKVGRIESSLT
jgi:2,3-dihydroxy-p-cumate/2,3-dihydroxybenzoate 3,4-dioxygenase